MFASSAQSCPSGCKGQIMYPPETTSINQHQSISHSNHQSIHQSTSINQHQSINSSINQNGACAEIWNRMRPRTLMQNQHTRELIRAWNINLSTTTKTWITYSNSVTMATFKDVPLVEFMFLVFTHIPGVSCCKWLRSLLLYVCYIFWVLINSLMCWFGTCAVQIHVCFTHLT